MKTLEEVKKQITDLREEAKGLGKKEAKKICKRLGLLYSVQLYLETSPTQQFIEKQKDNLEYKVKVINDGFSTWRNNNPKDSNVNNPKSKYNSYMGLRQVREQLATINYIL